MSQKQIRELIKKYHESKLSKKEERKKRNEVANMKHKIRKYQQWIMAPLYHDDLSDTSKE